MSYVKFIKYDFKRHAGFTLTELMIVVFKEVNSDTTVIAMTGHSSIPSALALLKEGAYDYITKPIDINEVRIIVKRTPGALNGDNGCSYCGYEKDISPPQNIT